MSNDIQKADQIAHRFYTKLCLVVSNARTTAEPRSQGKVDKWFNLETPDSDIFKDHLRIYRAVSCSPSLPPFELQVLLSVPELTNNQVLVYLAPDSSRVRMDPTPPHILLENWLLKFSPTHASPQLSVEPGDVAPSTIYKHGIPLFRSLFSLLRILPSWRLFRRLRRRMSTPYRNGNLTIQLRIRSLDDYPTDILDFGKSHVFSF
ncbi:autophagy-related protein 13 [Boletus coccyginus]|nr:autophagy-related protein 13 [Boletus coccyginus]